MNICGYNQNHNRLPFLLILLTDLNASTAPEVSQKSSKSRSSSSLSCGLSNGGCSRSYKIAEDILIWIT